MGTTLRRLGTTALVCLLAGASLASCTRPRPPVTTAPPTTTSPVTTGPGTTSPVTTAPPATAGRYEREIFQVETLAKDEVYKGNLKLNVYGPRGDTLAKRPVFIWQFGGGFVFGDRNQMDAQAQAAARRGFVGVSIDYSLGSAPTLQVLQTARQDANDAIAWLTARATQYRLDPAAIISGGVSAGAINSIHLITMAPAGTPAPIIGAVSLAGTSYVPARAGGPPIIMFSGRNDNIVAFSMQQSFCDSYKAQGNVCEQHIYNAGHAITGAADNADIAAKSTRFVRDLLRTKGY